MLPFILSSQKKGFVDLFYTYLGETVAVFLTYFFIDEKKTNGRKGILYFSISFAIILELSIYFNKSFLFVHTTTLLKMALRFFWPPYSAMTSEFYPT